MKDKKFCVKCKKNKSINNFHFNKNTKDGLHCYCKSCRKILSKIYNQDNKKRENERSKKYWWKNRKENLTKRKIYYYKNKKLFMKKQLERLQTKPKAKLRHNISSVIWQKLNRRLSSKKTKSTFDILPYTIEQLIQRLECQFKIGMSWNNYGKWHIDHKKADTRFNYTSTNDKIFLDCWSLANLQPLWAKDNLSKNKY